MRQEKSMPSNNEAYEELLGEVTAFSLKQDMDAIIVKGQDAQLRDRAHISDILVPESSLCYRMLVLSHFFKSNLVFRSAITAMHFENGWEVHRRWQRVLERAGVAESIEQLHVDPLYQVEGHIDAVIWFRGKLRLFELKGYQEKYYLDLAEGGKLPADAIVQCSLYMYLTGVHDGLIAVENKNTQEYCLWEVPYDEKLISPFIGRLERVKQLCEQYMAKEELPPRLEACGAPTDKRPQVCRYRDVCFMSKQEREEHRLVVLE